MPRRHAVCYVASDGYLLQTALSAIQARTYTPPDVPVFVVHVQTSDVSDAELFRSALAEAGVDLLEGSPDVLGGLHFAFARLFLPDFLPADVTDLLYLDGDTQIVADLAPLIFAEPPLDGLVAVKDPMVLSHGASPAFRQAVESWWEESGIPPTARATYVNSGVLRVSRSTLTGLRQDVQRILADEEGLPRFLDQDLLNRAMADRIVTVGLDWNFPGFLLGTRLAAHCRPRIIHFMSDPRPWQAPFRPWGHQYYKPYAAMVADHPELRAAWHRASMPTRLRYAAQQAFKHLTERRVWQSNEAVSALEAMRESDVRLE